MKVYGRYAWLDVMKLLAMYFVYVVHYSGMGRYGILLLAALVPCFFFASGFTVYRHADDAFLPFLFTRLRRIIWPYFVFGFLSLAVRIFVLEMSMGEIIAWVRSFLYGSRANIPVAALWFLPCLFCMSLLYHVLRRFLRNPWLLLGVCFAISAAVKLIHEAPVLPWGVDMAGRFLIYYALGDVAHTLTEGKTLAALPAWQKCALGVFTLGNIYVLYTHFYFGRGYFASLLGIAELPLWAQYAEQFLLALNALWCVTALAVVLSPIPGLQRAGRYTLVLCGTEQIVKTLVVLAFTGLGFTLPDTGGAAMLLQAAGMLMVAYYAFARPIARYLPWMLGRVKKS